MEQDSALGRAASDSVLNASSSFHSKILFHGASKVGDNGDIVVGIAGALPVAASSLLGV